MSSKQVTDASLCSCQGRTAGSLQQSVLVRRPSHRCIYRLRRLRRLSAEPNKYQQTPSAVGSGRAAPHPVRPAGRSALYQYFSSNAATGDARSEIVSRPAGRSADKMTPNGSSRPLVERTSHRLVRRIGHFPRTTSPCLPYHHQ